MNGLSSSCVLLFKKKPKNVYIYILALLVPVKYSYQSSSVNKGKGRRELPGSSVIDGSEVLVFLSGSSALWLCLSL